MWKVIQGDEKAEFIKEYQNKKYEYGNIVTVNLSGSNPKSGMLNLLSVEDFVMDNIVILVKVD